VHLPSDLGEGIGGGEHGVRGEKGHPFRIGV